MKFNEIAVLIIIFICLMLFLSRFPIAGFITSAVFFTIGVGFVLFGSTTGGGGRDVILPVTGAGIGQVLSIISLPYLILSYMTWKWLGNHEIGYLSKIGVTVVVYVVIPIALVILANFTNEYIDNINHKILIKEQARHDAILAATNSNDTAAILDAREAFPKNSTWKDDDLASLIVNNKKASPETLIVLADQYPNVAREVLIEAVKRNNLEYIEALAGKTPDLNKIINPDTDRVPVLYYVRSNEAFFILLKKGGQLDSLCMFGQNNFETTVLYEIIERTIYHPDYLKISEDDFIKAIHITPLDMKILSATDDSLLGLLSSNKLYRLADELFSMGMELDKRSLIEADDRATIDFLVRHGIPINARTTLDETPLTNAAYDSTVNMELVSALVENGADVDARNNEGMTALMIAAHRNEDPSTLINYLVDHGANVKIKSNLGKTAWDILSTSPYFTDKIDNKKREKLRTILQQ